MPNILLIALAGYGLGTIINQIIESFKVKIPAKTRRKTCYMDVYLFDATMANFNQSKSEPATVVTPTTRQVDSLPPF